MRKNYMLSQFMLIGVLSSAKFHSVAWLIDHAGLFVAWLFNVALTLALVFLATWTVVHIAPAAAGTSPPRFIVPRPRLDPFNPLLHGLHFEVNVSVLCERVSFCCVRVVGVYSRLQSKRP